MSVSPAVHPVRAFPFVFSTLALAAASVHAQTPPAPNPQLPEVIVSAQRIAQPISDVLADVSYIDRKQIQDSGAVTIADVLQRQPGLEITRNGGPGTITNVYTRGANNEFTAVYVDGVRVDSQAGAGGAAWAAIPLNQIDHIEILRGPAAAVYGSDAVAGVVQIFTRKGHGAFTPYAEVGLGSHDRREVKGGFSGARGPVDYAFGIERDLSHGYAINPVINPLRDGYRQTAASGRLGLQFTPTQRVDLTGTYTKMDAQFNNFFPPARILGSNRLRTLGATWAADWTKDYTTRLSFGQSQSRYADPSPTMNKTRLRNYTFLNEYHLGRNTFTATLERREDHFVNPATLFAPAINRDRHQNALALGYGYTGGPHTLQLNLRYDRDSDFGGNTTGGVAYGYEFLKNWRVTAGASTAFRVPTLYQRFSQYGDADLLPQKSRNVELGLRWADKGDDLGVRIYRNNIRDLVNFGPGGTCGQPFGCYGSTGKAHLQGLTLDGSTRIAHVNLGGSFDWMKPTDRTTHKLLLRRARRMLKLHADTRVEGWTLGGEAQFISHRDDMDFNTGNPVRLKPYALFNLYASRTIARDWDVLVRVDNLTDKKYQLAYGYDTPGRTVYASLRWTWR